MSIFKRKEPGDVQQASAPSAPAASAAAKGTPVAPTAAQRNPGVVPPPAAPVYSMRPAEAATRFAIEAQTAAPDRVRMTADEAQLRAQQLLQRRVRVAVEATRTAAPPTPVRRPAQQPAAPTPLPQVRQAFDPLRAAQAGLLNVAWRWQEAGAPIRAIHAYMDLLMRFPDTAAADAAVADLVELSEKLAAEGQFHTALRIYDQLEQLM